MFHMPWRYSSQASQHLGQHLSMITKMVSSACLRAEVAVRLMEFKVMFINDDKSGILEWTW